MAERKPLVLPQLLFPRHPARPNVLARLPPLAQGSGHASTPRLLDQGPHRTAKLAVSRPCGWRTQIPCDWLGLLKPPADLLSRQLLCARLPPAHSTPLYREEWLRGHDTGCKCRLSVQPYPKGNPMAELPSSPPVPVYYQYQKTKSLLLTIPADNSLLETGALLCGKGHPFPGWKGRGQDGGGHGEGVGWRCWGSPPWRCGQTCPELMLRRRPRR